MADSFQLSHATTVAHNSCSRRSHSAHTGMLKHLCIHTAKRQHDLLESQIDSSRFYSRFQPNVFAHLRGNGDDHYICLNASLVACEGDGWDVADTIMLVWLPRKHCTNRFALIRAIIRLEVCDTSRPAEQQL